jgi:phage anti-repressor protein
MKEMIAQIVKKAIASEQEGIKFGIDFDEVWEVLGYRNRNQAGRRLIAQLIHGYDYIKYLTPSSKKQPQKYLLSIEGFRALAMVANTYQGRTVREFFVNLEVEIKQDLERIYKLNLS